MSQTSVVRGAGGSAGGLALDMTLTVDDMTTARLQLWIMRERARRERLQAGEVIDWREERRDGMV